MNKISFVKKRIISLDELKSDSLRDSAYLDFMHTDAAPWWRSYYENILMHTR